MPVYDFKCTLCGRVEELKSYKMGQYLNERTGEVLPGCSDCGSIMSRVWSPVGVVWKCSRPTAYSAKDKDKKMSDVPDD